MLDWFDERNISFHNRFGIRLKPGNHIVFARGVEVEPYIGIHAGNTICSIAFMSYTNSNLPEDIIIGRYCSLAADLSFPRYRHPVEHVSTSIFTHDQDADMVVRFLRDDNSEYSNFYKNPQKGPITIENDVWIGQGVTIMPGLTIGTGSIIAANSVVTRSVKPYEIVGGNPARLIKMRFSVELIERLLLSEWWNYKFTDFIKINLSSPDLFLDEFEKIVVDLKRYSPEKIKIADVATFY